jgi:hypothetical protein
MTRAAKLGLVAGMACWAALQSSCAAQNPAQTPWQQPAAALASQIADILGPGEARLTIENLSSISTNEIPTIRKLLEADLKSHGVTVSGAESASSLRVTLSESVRERLWVAEVVEGNHSQVAIVELGPAVAPRVETAGGLLLRSQMMLSTHEPVLAALEIPGGAIALEPERIERYVQAASGWQSLKQASARQNGALARDPRGVLITADGRNFEAWLNGTECTGPLSAADAAGEWAVDCRASDDPWPIANANSLATQSSAENAAGSGPLEVRAFSNVARDYFTGVVSPSVGVDLPPFYSAALVARPAGSAALLIGGIDGRVQLVENGALHPIAGTRDWGSDFAVLKSSCGAGEQIIASGSGEAAHDSLRAYELPALEAIPASAPLAMDGAVTAMWSAPDGKSIFAVVRNGTDQYEVDRVTALCN